MIDFHTWNTPNGHKIAIALEELGLEYRVHRVNIGQNEQFAPAFLAISPNNKIPAIVDQDGPGGEPFALFESGAILLYLAEKTGRLLPAEPRARYRTVQWLMWQMGGFGPMLGQAHHFLRFAPEPIPYAQDRYRNEAARLYGVLDTQLQGREYVAGEYSVADIAILPWARLHAMQQVDIERFPAVRDWIARLEARPAVRRGLDLLKPKD